MKRPATTSLYIKKGRFLSIFVFVAFFAMAVSSLISNPASAFTINQNKTISFASTTYCDVDWNLDSVFNFRRDGNRGSQGNDYSGQPKAFDDWLNHIKPNLKDHRYLIYRDKTNVHIIVNYQNIDKYYLYFPKTGNPHLTDGNKSWSLKDKLYKLGKNTKWQDYDFMLFTISSSPKDKGCVDYPIHISSDSSAFPISPFNVIPPQAEIYRSNFINQYQDGYAGPVLPKPTQKPSFTPILSGQIDGQELSAIVEKDNMLNDFDYFSNQKYQYRLLYVNPNGLDEVIDTKVLSFNDPYRYNFKAESRQGVYKVEVIPVIQVPYEDKYDFQSIYIPLEYKGFSTNTYFSTKDIPFGTSKPQFVFETCDNIDIPCHLRNVITWIRKVFYDIIQFLKDVILPDFNSIKSVIESAQLQAKENFGAFNSLIDFIRISFGSFFDTVFPTLFTNSYTPPCNIFPNFNFFGSNVSIDICKFEGFMGTANFNKLRFLISGIFIFLAMNMFRSLFIKFFGMLGDAQS